MSNAADKQRHEENLESFTASFLLSEFRKDIRQLDSKLDSKIESTNNKIDAMNVKFETKIDSNFKWTLSILFLTTFSIIGTMIGLTFATQH